MPRNKVEILLAIIYFIRIKVRANDSEKHERGMLNGFSLSRFYQSREWGSKTFCTATKRKPTYTVRSEPTVDQYSRLLRSVALPHKRGPCASSIPPGMFRRS